METLPVIEIFGPTIQGEGPLIGKRTHFVRLGGCDSRCSWCDTKYAVLPEEVKKNKRSLTPDRIVFELLELDYLKGDWITLSGGNPAIHDLVDLIEHLKRQAATIALETQGTIYKPWMGRCDQVILSPKPPSSLDVRSLDTLKPFLNHVFEIPISLKIVVFDQIDLEWAKVAFKRYNVLQGYLQVGTTPGSPDDPIEKVRENILNRMEWLVQEVISDPELRSVRVLPQLHTLIYGQRRGI